MSATKTQSRTKKVNEKPAELILQRVVFPEDADFDTLPLYAEAGQAQPGIEAEPNEEPTSESATIEHTLHPDLVLGRRSLRVEAGSRVSFGTYFNAFPASYWRRWTSVESVTLRITVDGVADILVYRSSSRGDHQRVAKRRVGTGDVAEFDLPLHAFGDGGWYWFDIVSGTSDATLTSAEWATTTFGQHDPGRLSLGITTFNRPDFCIDLLSHIAADEDAISIVDTIFVIDQGTQLVEDSPRFAEVAAKLGDRLVLVKQPNLGGSGGFSRSMYETAYGEDSRYVLLLDDDVLLETEGMLRAVTFADQCRTPTIVGGHMLNMHVRSMMHAYGETVQRYRFFWGPAAHTYHSHNFATHSLRSTRWLHRRIDVDYNGWWMCLIPTEVVRRQGLALPIFIKWDDADYGLRAQQAGIPTVSLPGAAVWHVPWTDKDDTIDWQAYHHARNRVLVALLYSPYKRGGRLLFESFAVQIKHAISMQYSAAELRLWALEDILAGPEHLHRTLPTRLAEIRAFRTNEDDATVTNDPDGFPPPRRVKPPKRGKDPTDAKGISRYVAAAAGVYRQLQPVRPTAQKNPEIRVAAMDLRWRLLSQFDSAVVSTADGAGASWYKRDRTRFGDVMRRSAAVHQKLMVDWDSLAEQYREAVPDVVDPKAWINTWSHHDSE